ncbi:hypothetical protein PHMEG_00027036 [Phytophthora megakarya]|uniref:Uncharacterized protein n=1 Tax=Phytophthora megakarya TaxID=4795 RepID=A0A225V9J7_9STRA|nr:hypothetical protein PHMEG_00027036 [Phytophthora megakarya]
MMKRKRFKRKIFDNWDRMTVEDVRRNIGGAMREEGVANLFIEYVKQGRKYGKYGFYN